MEFDNTPNLTPIKISRFKLNFIIEILIMSRKSGWKELFFYLGVEGQNVMV